MIDILHDNLRFIQFSVIFVSSPDPVPDLINRSSDTGEKWQQKPTLFRDQDELFNAFTKVVTDFKLEAHHWQNSEGVFQFSEIIQSEPPPGSLHPLDVLIFKPCNKNYIIYTANLQDGWYSLIYRMSAVYGFHVSALTFRFSDDGLEYPARSFAKIVNCKVVREVHAVLDTKWVFFEDGEPVPGEDLSCYKRQRIRDRLTNEQIMAVANAHGVEFPNNAPLREPGALLKRIQG
jgi:hypothetical protein